MGDNSPATMDPWRETTSVAETRVAEDPIVVSFTPQNYASSEITSFLPEEYPTRFALTNP